MRRRRRRQKLPADPVTLMVGKLSHEGRGIAHADGKVIFVDGALAGEEVEAIYTSRRDSYDESRLARIIQASPDRVEPPCQYAGVCGGCSLQHFEPAAQLAFKQDVLLERLHHALPGHAFEVLDALTGPSLGYRRKARLAVRYVHKKSRVLVGFREKQSTFITQMDHCEVLDARIAALLPGLADLIKGLQRFRQIPQIEVAAGDPGSEDCTVALVFRHLDALPAGDMDALVNYATGNQVQLYLQPGGNETVHKVYPADSPDRLYYDHDEAGIRLAFHPMDFTQVNAGINRDMVNRAINLLSLDPGDKVLDLFCGLGNFTLPIARLCTTVCGVEGSAEMIDRAMENAAANGVGNAGFHCANLEKSMQGAEWFSRDFNKVLLDPPRSGAWEILPDIVALKPERIVYVSCNPATLARDAEYLGARGYTLAKAGVMDMFPHTTHVESIALFTRD